MTCRTTTTDREIGALIRHCRKRKGILQTELAQAIGVCGTQISRYERGHEFVSLVRRRDIAEALGVEPAMFADPTLMEVTPAERAHLEALRAGRRSSFATSPVRVAVPVRGEAASC